MAKPKLTADHKALILDYVREYGRLAGCINILPIRVSQETIERLYLPESGTFDRDFAIAIQQAKEDFATIRREKSKDAQAHRWADHQFDAVLQSGMSNTVETYNEHGQLTGRKVYKRAGIPFWMWQVIHPEKSFTEEALLLIVASLYKDMIQSELADQTRKEFAAYLSKWSQKELENLKLQGKKLKYIKEDPPE